MINNKKLLQSILIVIFYLRCVESYSEFTNYKEVYEGDFVDLTCARQGHVITILHASFTTVPKKKCPLNLLRLISNENEECSHPNAMNIAKKVCNDRKKCRLYASYEFFGWNICGNMAKKLTVLYQCTKARACREEEMECDDNFCIPKTLVNNGFKDCSNGEDEKGASYTSIHACQNENLVVSCPGQNIFIVNATYGHLDDTKCVHKPNMLSTRINKHCFSPTALDLVKNRCENKSLCIIPSTNNFFGNPCGGTYKYTEVHYFCKSVTTCSKNEFECSSQECIDNTKICDGTKNCKSGEDEINCAFLNAYICQGMELNITCPVNQRFHLADVNMYNPEEVEAGICGMNVICHIPTAKIELEKACNRRNQCIIKKSDPQYKTLCSTLRMYLGINYECL